MEHEIRLKCELYNDSMQGWKCYPIQKAQLIIADVPYNVGNNFYGSNPMWYVGGDNKNGESKLAGKAAFASDFNFNLYEYFHFCSRLMKKDDTKPAGRGRSTNSPCMIVFCSFESPWFNNGKDDDMIAHYGYIERKEAVEIVRDLCVKEEPSVQPEKPKGKWIVYKAANTGEILSSKCDQCGYEVFRTPKFNFCPNCGADMRGGE